MGLHLGRSSSTSSAWAIRALGLRVVDASHCIVIVLIVEEGGAVDGLGGVA